LCQVDLIFSQQNTLAHVQVDDSSNDDAAPAGLVAQVYDLYGAAFKMNRAVRHSRRANGDGRHLFQASDSEFIEARGELRGS
jgi:hypothetical protein